MAKQIGAMPISGKIDNLVYYNTKNGGAVVRRAYPNLGKRVKTDKVYANTRRNNAEFGMCGYVASQLLSPILQRWKYILKPDAVGELTKANFELLKLDTENPWGQRDLGSQQVAYQQKGEELINSLSKNIPPQGIVKLFDMNQIEVTDSEYYYNLLIDGYDIYSIEEVNELIQIGYSKVNIYVGGIDTSISLYNTGIGIYQKSKGNHFINSALTVDLIENQKAVFPDGYSVGIPNYVYLYTDDSTLFACVIIFVIPVKNGKEMVEAGSFYLKGLPA